MILHCRDNTEVKWKETGFMSPVEWSDHQWKTCNTKIYPPNNLLQAWFKQSVVKYWHSLIYAFWTYSVFWYRKQSQVPLTTESIKRRSLINESYIWNDLIRGKWEADWKNNGEDPTPSICQVPCSFFYILDYLTIISKLWHLYYLL